MALSGIKSLFEAFKQHPDYEFWAVSGIITFYILILILFTWFISSWLHDDFLTMMEPNLIKREIRGYKTELEQKMKEKRHVDKELVEAQSALKYVKDWVVKIDQIQDKLMVNDEIIELQERNFQEKHELQKQIADHKQERLTTLVTDLQSQVSSMQQDFNEFRTKIAKLDAERITDQNRISETQSTNFQLSEMNFQLSRRLKSEKLWADQRSANGQIGNLRFQGERDKFEKEKNRLQEDNAALKKAKTALEEERANLEQENKTLEESNKTFQEEHKAMTEEKAKLEKVIAKKDTAAQRQVDTINSLQTVPDRLRQEKEQERQAKLAEAKKAAELRKQYLDEKLKVGARDEWVESLKKDVNAEKRRVKEREEAEQKAINAYNKLNVQMKKLEENLEDSQKSLKKAEERYSAKQVRNSELHSETKKAQRELADVVKREDGHLAEIATLKEGLLHEKKNSKGSKEYQAEVAEWQATMAQQEENAAQKEKENKKEVAKLRAALDNERRSAKDREEAKSKQHEKDLKQLLVSRKKDGQESRKEEEQQKKVLGLTEALKKEEENNKGQRATIEKELNKQIDDLRQKYDKEIQGYMDRNAALIKDLKRMDEARHAEAAGKTMDPIAEEGSDEDKKSMVDQLTQKNKVLMGKWRDASNESKKLEKEKELERRLQGQSPSLTAPATQHRPFEFQMPTPSPSVGASTMPMQEPQLQKQYPTIFNIPGLGQGQVQGQSVEGDIAMQGIVAQPQPDVDMDAVDETGTGWTKEALEYIDKEWTKMDEAPLPEGVDIAPSLQVQPIATVEPAPLPDLSTPERLAKEWATLKNTPLPKFEDDRQFEGIDFNTPPKMNPTTNNKS